MRARQQSVGVAAAAGAAILLLLVVAAPPGGNFGLVAGELLLSFVVAVSVGVAADRWNQARMVDLRHHDLFAGFRENAAAGGAPPAPAQPPAPLAVPQQSAEHQLFGDCSCPSCAAGHRLDLRTGAVRPSSSRSVVDLRSGAMRRRGGRLGQR